MSATKDAIDNTIEKTADVVEQTVEKVNTQVQGTYLGMYRDFQEWAFSNNLIVIAGGFAIGIASKEVIETILDNVVRPLLIFSLKFSVLKIMYNKALQYVSKTHLEPILEAIGAVSWSIMEWITIIVMTFVILEYFLNRRIFGLKSTVKDNDKISFLKAKSGANEKVIIASSAELERRKKKDEIETKLGKEITRKENAQLLGMDKVDVTEKKKEQYKGVSSSHFAYLNSM
jgi:large-conductance mechanosensitive channel